MNTNSNLTYFLIGFINGVARPWEAFGEDEELIARSLGNSLFPDLAQDDEAFGRALKAAAQIDTDIHVQRLKELVAQANERARTQTQAVAAPARR